MIFFNRTIHSDVAWEPTNQTYDLKSTQTSKMLLPLSAVFQFEIFKIILKNKCHCELSLQKCEPYTYKSYFQEMLMCRVLSKHRLVKYLSIVKQNNHINTNIFS